MNILVVMIPLSILLLVGAGIAFFWAVDHDQFDDMETPRLLPLLDNPPPQPTLVRDTTALSSPDAPANALPGCAGEGSRSLPLTPSSTHVVEAPQPPQAAASERTESA